MEVLTAFSLKQAGSPWREEVVRAATLAVYVMLPSGAQSPTCQPASLPEGRLSIPFLPSKPEQASRSFSDLVPP